MDKQLFVDAIEWKNIRVVELSPNKCFITEQLLRASVCVHEAYPQ